MPYLSNIEPDDEWLSVDVNKRKLFYALQRSGAGF
jgi:hypothetical protein